MCVPESAASGEQNPQIQGRGEASHRLEHEDDRAVSLPVGQCHHSGLNPPKLVNKIHN